MIIVVDKKEQVANIENYLNTFHIHFYTSHQKTCSIIETLTDTFPFDEKNLYAFEGVLSIHFNQKKYSEVAQMLNISTNTVKKHIMKALSSLREELSVSVNGKDS